MADNDQSKIRYDDFIGNVQPDPAKPESTIMLSGFVGHGPEGHVRIYPDPTLGTWYDIPEGDVVYSTPIADSKLGGSYIWVRASSEIKPGSAAPAATEAVQPQQAAAVGMTPTPRTHCRVCDPPMAAAAMQPTPTVQTHCFICPPHTLAVHCWTAPVVCDTIQMPTPATHCFICPPPLTPATICTLHGHCPPPPQHSVPPTLCAVPQTLPCSLLCQADPRAAAAPAAMALPHTAATVCTQFGCPPQGPVGGQLGTFHFTNWCSLVGCNPPTNGCGVAGGAPQAAGGLLQTHFLCTQGLATFCGCTPGIDCNAAPGNVQTQAPICTQGFPTFCGCTPGIDCMGLAARAAPQQANTGVTVCVTDCVPPGNQMMKAAVGNPMDPTPQSRCFVCDPPNMLAAMQPTPTVQTHCFICPPHTQAVHCWTAPVVCDTMQMPTPATRCFICPPQHPTPLTVPPWVCGQPGGFTPATVCTHAVHCPTQPVVCNLQPTQPVVCGVLPPSFGCTQGCQQGGAQPQLEAMAAPAHPNTAATVCTQPLGCTFVGCTPHCPGGGHTPATVCTHPLGCTFVGCTPHCPGGGHTQLLGCTFVGCTPHCPGGGHTQLLGCTFVGCTPHCPGGGFTPATVCTQPNGVFTPFGR